MQATQRNAQAMTSAVLAPVLLAIGASIPLVRSSLGYTYSVVGPAAIAVYLIAVALLAFNVMADKIRADIAARLHLVAVCVLAATALYGLYHGNEGRAWFRAQAAFDTPALEQSDKQVFWATLDEMTGSERLPFGGLSNMYRMYGPNAALNDRLIYSEVVNGLDAQQQDTLLARSKIAYWIMPVGILAWFASLAMQWRLWARSRKGAASAG